MSAPVLSRPAGIVRDMEFDIDLDLLIDDPSWTPAQAAQQTEACTTLCGTSGSGGPDTAYTDCGTCYVTCGGSGSNRASCGC